MCVVMGLLTVYAWFPWCWKHWQVLPHAKVMMSLLVIAVGSTMLELFDFPPWFWVIDSHSLFHLATTPTGYLWFNFAISDSKFLIKMNI